MEEKTLKAERWHVYYKDGTHTIHPTRQEAWEAAEKSTTSTSITRITKGADLEEPTWADYISGYASTE